MKQQLVVMILSKLLQPGKLLLIHATKKSSGTTNPAYLIDFDGGLAHCWHITQKTGVENNDITLQEAWQDVDDWVSFTVEKVVSLDEAKIYVERLNKLRKVQENRGPQAFLEFLNAQQEAAQGTKQ